MSQTMETISNKFPLKHCQDGANRLWLFTDCTKKFMQKKKDGTKECLAYFSLPFGGVWFGYMSITCFR